MPAGIVGAILGTTLTGAAAVATDVIGGALIGGGLSAAEGGSFGKGALLGGISGGALGFGPEIGADLGIGTVGGDALAGAAGGALGGAVTGGNIGKDALFGGIGGGISGAISSPGALGGDSAGAAAGPATSGAAPAAGGPAGVGTAGTTAAAVGLPTDLTSIGNPSSLAALPAATGDFSVTPGTYNFSGGGGPGTAPSVLSTVDATQNYVPGVTPGSPTITSGTVDYGAAAPIAPPVSGQTTGGVTGGAAAPQSFGQKLTSGLTSPGAIVSALGLGYEALSQPKLPSISGLVNQLQSTAGNLSAEAAPLLNYVNNGTLPPGVMEQVNLATQSQKAAIKSQFASMGLAGSTEEATALGDVDRQAAGQIFDIANNLLQSGIKLSGMSTDIYGQILNETNAQNQQLSSAIANFASSVAGGGRGVPIYLAGAQPGATA